MTHRSLLVLCTSLLLGMTPTAWSQSTAPQKQSKKPATPESTHTSTKTTTKVLKSIFGESDSTLVADKVPISDRLRVKEIKKEVDDALREDLSAEELMYPAIDLYGEGSWTEYVNPFSGNKKAVKLPDTLLIDCSSYSHPLDRITRVNSDYGYRRRFGRMHYGIDLHLSVGDTVRSVFDGKIRVVDYERRGYGKYIVIRHPNGLETVYGHLSKHLVKENQIVRAGEAIGLGGNTGRSTGPHLHLETRLLGVPINPAQIIDFDRGIPLREQYVFLSKGNLSAKKYASGSTKSHSKSGKAIATYRIRKGDTLSTIAKRHGVSVSQLCRLNGISSKTTLRAGRVLRISS